jgi:Na+/H+ antiporter NhaC
MIVFYNTFISIIFSAFFFAFSHKKMQPEHQRNWMDEGKEKEKKATMEN